MPYQLPNGPASEMTGDRYRICPDRISAGKPGPPVAFSRYHLLSLAPLLTKKLLFPMPALVLT
jgi:hypothetical protein